MEDIVDKIMAELESRSDNPSQEPEPGPYHEGILQEKEDPQPPRDG